MIELLGSATNPPLWNGVTITTAIGAAVAILVSLGVLALTWVKIPKPYWVVTEMMRMPINDHVPTLRVEIKNLGDGDASHVVIYSTDVKTGKTSFPINKRIPVVNARGGTLVLTVPMIEATSWWDAGKLRFNPVVETDPPAAAVHVVVRWRQSPIHRIYRKKKFTLADPKKLAKARAKRDAIEAAKPPLKPNF